MGNKKGLFLDTATQIARHWHSPPECKEIQQQLEGANLYCSRYVKCQYKAKLLASMIYLYNLCRLSPDLLAAIQKATEGKYSKEAGGSLTAGKLALIVDIAYWVSRQYKSYATQIQRLEVLIEDRWETTFYDGLELPLVDETGCVYAEGEPERGSSGAFKPMAISCRKDTPPDCRIKKFWDIHRNELEALANMDIDSIKARPMDRKNLQSVKDYASAIISDGIPYGERCTVHLSDSIICLESKHCPEPSAVHSTNKKHFRSLGEVLGVEWEPKD